MAENINFIPATELPEATSDEVSVLCVENGELKQKPGASLGGGDSAISRVYTSADVVLENSSELYILDEEVLNAVLLSVNDGTPMPNVCLHDGNYVYFPTKIYFGFGVSLDANAVCFTINSKTYYVFNTYENAFDYYDR